MDVRATSGALTPKIGLTDIPTSHVSGAQEMAPYTAIARAVGYLGEKVEEAGIPYQEAAGAKAVEMDADGTPKVNWRWGEFTSGDRAYNAAARQAGVAMYRVKIQNDLQQMRVEHEGDPAAFQAATKGYIKSLGKADPLLRPFVMSDAESVAGQHFRGLLSDKERTDTVRFSKDLDAREGQLTDTLENLAEQGGIDTPEFQAAQNELVDLRRQRAANPKFTYSPQQAEIDNTRTSSHLKAVAIVGQFRRQYQETGDLPGTLKAAEERLNASDLNLPPDERAKYLGAITARTSAAAAVRQETIRQASDKADLLISALNSEDKVDPRTLDESIQELRGLRQHAKVAQLETARLVNEIAPVLRHGTAAEKSAAMTRLRGQASAGVVDASTVLKQFEGYRSDPYWDVNAHRVGYGSDTITREDGTVVRVTPGMSVTRADADRDLSRRIDQTQAAIKSYVGEEAWARLTPNAQSALTSVAYNYGSLPARVARVVAETGDADAIAKAVEGLKRDNGGVNAGRRQQEANLIRGGGGFTGPVYASAVKQLQAKFNDEVLTAWSKVTDAWDHDRQPTADELQNVIALAPLLSDGKKRQEIVERFERERVLERVDGQSVTTIRAAVKEMEAAAEAGGLPPAGRALLDGLQKREKAISERLDKDPLSRVATGDLASEAGIGVRESIGPLQFDSVDGLRQQFQLRATAARHVAQFDGVPLPSVLRPDEVPQIRSILQSGSGETIQAFFSAVGGLDDDALFATLSDKKLADTVEGLAKTTDPAKYTAAMSGMDQLLRRNPDAFVKAFGADAVAKVQGWQQKLAYETPEALAKRLQGRADGLTGKVEEELRSDARAYARKTGDEEVLSEFDAAPTSRAALIADYRQAVEDAYIASGDLDAAHKAALTTLKTVWKPSPTNGGRVMRFAPEQYYPTVDGSHDWLAKQVRETIASRMPPREEPIVGPDGVPVGGSTVSFADVPYTLVSTPDTQADISAKRPPRYHVVYKNPITGRDEAFDARFNVDKAMEPVRDRQAKERDQAKRNHKRDDQNQEIRDLMGPGFAPVDPVTGMPQ